MTTCDKCDGFCPTLLIPPLKKLAVIAEGENNTWRRLENFLRLLGQQPIVVQESFGGLK
jgi:hypothetical protein